MKFFIDTANVDEIRKANDMGIIAGVTTNPSLIAKEGRDYAETLAEIATIVDGPISGEVKATTVDAETMVAEGEAIYALDPKHMVVKIPMTAEGLKAIKALSAKGIPTNCTLVFSANQALLAARAGATYVSPFLGRLDDIGQPGIELIETIHDMFLNYPRHLTPRSLPLPSATPIHVTDCALWLVLISPPFLTRSLNRCCITHDRYLSIEGSSRLTTSRYLANISVALPVPAVCGRALFA